MAEKVKIVFVGVGSMGQCPHLKNYVLIDNGIPRVYNNFKEMFLKEKFDGIVASQPFTRHGVLIPELLKAKVPIFIEKPLASSVEIGEKIVKVMKESKTWIMVGYHKRSDPATIYVKEKIEKFKKTGEMGKMKYIRITIPPGDWIAGGFNDLITTDETLPPLEKDLPPSDMKEEIFKKYVDFVNYYIHQINLMRYLLGEPYVVKYAEPTGVLMGIESKSGIPGIIEMFPYTTSIDWQETATVFFEKGYIKLTLPAPLAINRPGKVEIFKDLGENSVPCTFIPQLPWVSAMYQQAVNFIKAIKNEIKPVCDVEEALEDLKIAKDYIRILHNI
ncbi:Gfo/Idh/MocA family oxidoreductase [bacterium]|nr:Gfo/Idh/MocA family oxidoreductase [bacterium]